MKIPLDRELYTRIDVEGSDRLPTIKVEWYHEAKALFLNGMGIPEISATLNIRERDIKILVLGVDFTGRDPQCWYYERVSVDSAASKAWLKSVIDDKGAVVEAIVSDGADILRTGLLKLKEAQAAGVVLTTKQLKELSGIIIDMDKLARLESGKATEIIKNVGLTPDEARKIIASDPFLRKPKDIEVEVVK